MSSISHHVSEPMLVAYAAGSLGYAFELVVASHVSLCDECRARMTALETVGGAVLDASAQAPLSPGLRSGIMDRLDEAPAPLVRHRRMGVYPGPVMAALDGRAPRWTSLGLGVRQAILHEDDDGSVRLLQIPPEQAVPEHGHGGLELTLVLQGSFHDETGTFGVGDLERADGEMAHMPVAGKGAPCICLAATDAPLRFRTWLPRLTQRYFRI